MHTTSFYTALFSLIGYLSGSLLFADYWIRKLKHVDIFTVSNDRNPGTYNAFRHGGFLCGILTLAGDLGKGFFPVFFYCYYMKKHALPLYPGICLVMLSPVVGHVFSVFHSFRGGKAIAVSFGVLLGTAPDILLAAILAVCYIFFALLIRDHCACSLAAYISASVIATLWIRNSGSVLTMWLISLIVCTKHLAERCSKNNPRQC